MKSIILETWIAALCLATVLVAQDKPAAGDKGYESAAAYKYGQSRADLAAIEAEIRAATPAQYKVIEAKLLAALKNPQATADSKRYLCRMLGVVGSADSIPALAALLGDEQLSHTVRIALEPMQDPAAGAALRDALGAVKGKLRIGVISSLGARRDGQAVPALAKMTGDADAAVAAAAVNALGEIATLEAAKALEAAANAAKSPADSRRVAMARIACAAGMAKAGQAVPSAAMYRSLLDSKDAPAVRGAALAGLLSVADRQQAAAILVEKLQGDDAKLKLAAAAAFATAGDKELKMAVVGQLPALAPAGQQALLGVLLEQADLPARAAVLKVLQESPNEAVRLAALECLATHGQADDVPMLVTMAIQGAGDLKNSAAKVLKMIRTGDVDGALLKGLESADAARRGVILGALEARKAEGALPVLAKMAAGSDPAAAGDATRVLASMGTARELPALLGVMTATGDGGLRSAAENAVASICTRANDKQPCSQAVLEALDKASAPTAKAACLRLLPRVKTEAALAAIRKALQDAQGEVSEAALRALANWPDLSAVPILLEFAGTTTNERYAIVSLQGCLRLAGVKERPAEDRLGIYRRVVETAKRADEKKQALAGAAEIISLESAKLIESCLKDSALADDAALAAARLARQLGPVSQPAAQALLEAAQSAPGVRDSTRPLLAQAMAALKDAGRCDGYVVAWMLAGPYTKAGKSVTDLFDEPFAPEQADARDVKWQTVTIPPGQGPRVLKLHSILGGDSRVAYVKTTVTSDREQEIVLESGSDDGLKVWLNGQVVLSRNVVGPCQPGSNKTKLKLKKGPNTLLAKVTQGGGEWEVCVRLRTADGQDVEGIVVSPLEK